MKLACIAFTHEGMLIAERIKEWQGFEVDVFGKDSYKQHLGRIFKAYKGVVFIGSTGIAVRLCAPYLVHKTIDPAVVVIDDLGRYCISLVSGHLGGANSLACRLSDLLGCQPIITTASDGRNIEAVDIFAMRNDLYIENLEDAKKITAFMVAGKRVKLDSEQPIELNYHNLADADYDGVIFVSTRENVSSCKPYCILRPKNIYVGIGCRRGKHKDEILKAIREVFKVNNLCLSCIKALATVDVKRDEEGIIEACKELECKMLVIGREEIGRVEDQFSPSRFVKSAIGVSSVCEPCAYLAGGEIIVSKTAINGITIAVSKER
ncbi:MAG: cbiG [Clostridia bacterium]|jgi:cobalt-precorrin 5A hydrolase|nr:cbiG [Clostridia bacterium]